MTKNHYKKILSIFLLNIFTIGVISGRIYFDINNSNKKFNENQNSIPYSSDFDDVGSTNSTCGFHVHLSTIKKKELDPIKLLMFVEENSILKHFGERKDSS